jgi:hypothetical protein
MARSPKLFGGGTVLGVMPDWNPAEMIGLAPRRLAASLYRELITKSVWRRAREAMGYRELPPVELMVLIGGRPFIDVRASFNSFLPSGLGRETSELLVGAWLDRLDRHPNLHDKIEFDVAQTVLDFCFDRTLDERYPGLLDRDGRAEFRDALRRLTFKCLDSGPGGTLERALGLCGELARRQAERALVAPEPRDGASASHIPLVAALLDECKRLGTMPFSIIARHAFIAESLLRTAVLRGAFGPERLRQFKASIRTVSGEMTVDFKAVLDGGLGRDEFMSRYGHLRPGTYDILSPRYVERADLFSGGRKSAPPPPGFEFDSRESAAIAALFAEAGMGRIDAPRLEAYARAAVAGREKAKFIFTRNLSDALEHLAAWGRGIGLSREDISFLDIIDCLHWDTHSLLDSPKAYFGSKAREGREFYDLTRSLKLGYIIRSPRDVLVVPRHRSAPNFVGKVPVEADVAHLDSESLCDDSIAGRIVCIENADPGFDWVFTRNIAGLVTMFGGANSHMAIRCAEYGLPAAIGVGEKLFLEISSGGRCCLNPEEGTIRMAE